MSLKDFDGLCIEMDTGGMTPGRRGVIYKVNDAPLVRRLELLLEEAVGLAETIIHLAQSESCIWLSRCLEV